MGVVRQLVGMTGAGILLANGCSQSKCRRQLRLARDAFAPSNLGDHVVIIGSGVVGVTTAYELVKKGLNVTVIERQSRPAMETSHANAGTLNYVIRTLTASPENLKLAITHLATHVLGRRTVSDDVREYSNPTSEDMRRPDPSSDPPRSDSAASAPEPQDKSIKEQLEDAFNVTLPDIDDAIDSVLERFDSIDIQQALDDLMSSVDLETDLESLKAKFDLSEEIEQLQAYIENFRFEQEMESVLAKFQFFGLDTRLMQSYSFWKWSFNFLLLCFWETENRRAYVNELVDYSLNALVETAETEAQIQFNFRQCGSLTLFFEQAQYEEEVARLEPSRDTLLTRDEAIAIEPSLARIKFIGALQHGKDRVGNCSQYVEELARVCQEKGVTFLFEHSASDLNIENDRITSVKVISSDGTQRDVACDYVVLCAGVESCAPLVSSGWDWLPIMPVRGYTITGTASSKPEDVPQEYVLLEQPLHVLATRFGPKMRFASHAEITMAIEPNAARLEDLQEVVRTFFPDAFVNDDIELWMGRRPMTSDSMPIVGVGHLPNLLLCTGHGSDGWRWSHGTARLTAALLAGEPLPLPLRYLSLSRFFWF